MSLDGPRFHLGEEGREGGGGEQVGFLTPSFRMPGGRWFFDPLIQNAWGRGEGGGNTLI